MGTAFGLDGKVIMVTGASSGIGKQVAISIAKQGARVILIGRNVQRLQAVQEQLEGTGHAFYSVDITDTNALNNTVAGLDTLHGVVHAAGILALAPVKILSQVQLEEITRTNYFAPVHFTQLLLNAKKLPAGASIVFITSVNGIFTAVKGFGAYAGSKAALNSMAKVMALEYAARKIRFNTITPGMIKTEMYQEMVQTLSRESIEQDKKKYPLGDYGEPEDVANAAIYLLSDASKWVTGTSLIVDGGLTIA